MVLVYNSYNNNVLQFTIKCIRLTDCNEGVIVGTVGIYAGGPVALLTPLPRGKMSPRYLELKRLLDFFPTPPDAPAGICIKQ